MGLAKVGPELNLEEDASFEANRIGNASVAALFQDQRDLSTIAIGVVVFMDFYKILALAYGSLN